MSFFRWLFYSSLGMPFALGEATRVSLRAALIKESRNITHGEVQMDTVTILTVGVALVVAVPTALVVFGWLLGVATQSNHAAARWAFFCGGK